MSIYAFAWAYDKYQAGKAWLEATEPGSSCAELNGIVRYAVHSFMMEMRDMHQSGRHSPQMR